MAARADIEFTYSSIDRIFRLSMGELADFSGAKYDGDFSITLEQAQARKHQYIAERLGFEPGQRLLDLGSGWGALLDFARRRGLNATGVTLSAAQARASRRHGLDVHLHDARQVTRDTFGSFDAVASLGAFEHFCSPEDYRAQRQERVYRQLFENVSELLPVGGRLYLQTMVFGANMIGVDEISVDAPRESDAWYLALLGCQFPGSFLPFGQEQIVRCATPGFKLISSVSGRLDYIETINQWSARIGEPGVRKSALKLLLVPKWLTSREFRLGFTSGVAANQVCFQRELLDHHRLVFERVPAVNAVPDRGERTRPRRDGQMVRPPSTGSATPVMNEAGSEARNAAA